MESQGCGCGCGINPMPSLSLPKPRGIQCNLVSYYTLISLYIYTTYFTYLVGYINIHIKYPVNFLLIWEKDCIKLLKWIRFFLF